MLSKKKLYYKKHCHKIRRKLEVRTRVAELSDNAQVKRLQNLKKRIMEGPYYTCVVCNRSLYRRSVLKFSKESYDISELKDFEFHLVLSYDDLYYICQTCHSKLKSKTPKIPCQAVSNKLEIFDFPPDYPKLRRLERVLIAQMLLFKKIAKRAVPKT